MAKAYWVAIYRSTPHPEAHAAYVKLAVPALTTHGARFLAQHARADLNQAALKAFNNAAERDFRIVEGLA